MKSLYSLYIYNETRTLGAQAPEGSNGVVCQKYVMSKPRIITAQLNCWTPNCGIVQLCNIKNTMKLDIHPVFTEQLPDLSHDFSSSVNIFSRNIPSCFQETTTAMNQKKIHM